MSQSLLTNTLTEEAGQASELMTITNTVLEVRTLRFSALAQGPESGELVLFLHGFPEFADTWAPVMDCVASAGFRGVAVDQRGYSAGARPQGGADYALDSLVSDIGGFADALGHEEFHLVGHDVGALLAWNFAAKYPERVKSLTALSTPHPDALFETILTDEDQKSRSRYIDFFKMPEGAAETYFQANDYERLRAVYQGKVSETAMRQNIARLAEPGAFTAALSWYRALDPGVRIGTVSVPTLYVWSSQDHALGEVAALKTQEYVAGPYRFERLNGVSHWLLAEAPDEVSKLILEHLLRCIVGL